MRLPIAHKHQSSGLSLVELLAVVVIILSFSMVVVSVNTNATRSAEQVTFQQQQAQLQKVFGTWVASQPSLSEAIRSWRTEFKGTGALLNRLPDPDAPGSTMWEWGNGPMSLLSPASYRQFRVKNSVLTSHAGEKLGRGFVVNWGDNNPEEMRNQDPKVEDVALP
jgi:hypothetical protein